MAKRRTKKRVAKPKPVKHPLAKIPEDLKPYIVKKFRSTAVPGIWVLAVTDKHNVAAVATVDNWGVPTVVRDFPIPDRTTLPMTAWTTTQRQLSIWYARWIARHSKPPSEKSERSHRKRIWKKMAAKYHEHAVVRKTLQTARVLPMPQRMRQPPKLSAFICSFDPKAPRRDRPIFEIHHALCERVDQLRRRCQKHDGDTWVIEAHTPEEAVRMQLVEFEEDQKGYVIGDFLIHQCNANVYINSKGAGRR